jgi:hypothetical protein
VLLSVVAMLALSVSLSGCDQFFLGGGGSGGSSESTDGADNAGGGDSALVADECPVGTWTLVNDSWASELEALFAVSDMGSTTVQVTGTVVMEWEKDETYAITSTESQYDIAGTTGGSPFAMRVLHNGTETGEWLLDASGSRTQVSTGGTIESVLSMGQSEATLQVMEDGDETPEFFSGTMTVECTPTGMSTTVFDAGTSATVDWVPSRP